MNIFILDTDPALAAQYQCNKHVVKMIVESAQLLSTAWPANVAPYRHTHFNHPCAKWVRQSLANYAWLVQHAIALCSEYTARYNKTHKTHATIQWLASHKPNLPSIGLTPFAIAIKDVTYHDPDPVIAYRAYYIGEKSRFARWEPKARQPAWWPFQVDEMIEPRRRKAR